MMPARAILALSTFFLAVAPAWAEPAKVPAYLEVKDWLIACDNTRHCVAKGFSDDHLETEMDVIRDAGPDAGPRVVIQSLGPLPAGKATLDGKPFAWPKASKSGIFDKETPGSAVLSLDGPAATGLLKALRNGTTLSFGPPKGDADPTVSLAGLAAVLLTMDDVQSRIGTETALMRVGSAKGASVPAAPALPPATKAAPPAKPFGKPEAAALIRALRGSDIAKAQCDDGIDQPMDEADALTNHLGLVMIECIRGAYQESDLVFLVTDGKAANAKQLILPLPLSKDPLDMFTMAGFDAKTAQFTTAAKGRGPADCGSSATWVFDGKDFVLQDYARQDKCGGVAPGDWPALMRTAGSPKE